VAQWQAERPDRTPLRVSVNLSGRQLTQPGLVSTVRQVLEESGLAAGTLILELTETEMMHDTEASLRQLRSLKELDVRIAVDDFGTGYSSLGYLQRFPIDILKVAKEFVDGLAEGSDDAIMARAIVALSLNLGLQTVAEGIEVDEQAQRLRELGCEFGQGYLFSRPLPAETMARRLLADALVTH
jgi:EAL domain-containing protein (putative c-di-GMP-specific phosphodiesterase class I)